MATIEGRLWHSGTSPTRGYSFGRDAGFQCNAKVGQCEFVIAFDAAIEVPCREAGMVQMGLVLYKTCFPFCDEEIRGTGLDLRDIYVAVVWMPMPKGWDVRF